jgi:hypothetical protein
VFGSGDVELEQSGKLSAKYEGKMQKVRDESTGETDLCTIIERERTDTHLRFAVPAILLSSEWIEQDSNREVTDSVTNGWVQVQTDLDGANATVLSMVPMQDDEIPVASKQLIDVYDFEIVQFPFFGRKPTRSSDGSLKPYFEWDTSSTMYATEIELDKGTQKSFSFVREDIDKKDKCYLLFTITDVQGNKVSSELIPIKR